MVQVPQKRRRDDGTFDVVRDDEVLLEAVSESAADDFLDGYDQALELEE